MYPTSITCNRSPIQILVLATFVVFVLFALQGNKGFSLWDEGFLWYGAQRVMLGEVPIRDFMAYDPGRYYWSAGIMTLMSDNGIMTLRVAVATFQTFGLFVGLSLIDRNLASLDISYLLLSAITLVVWMFPRHKLFDISLSISLVGALAFLVRHPTGKRYFLAGLSVGVVAIFGRNHGVYGVIGSLGVMVWLNLDRTAAPELIKGIGLWTAGVAVGFTPILLMAVLLPGFAIAFWESIRLLFEIKTTNLPLPIPWPWRVNMAAAPLGQTIRSVLVGLFFISTVVFGVLSTLWAVRQKLYGKRLSPAFVASSFLALPYAHFAYSRADVDHLAQGIFPLLIGCLVLISTQPAKVKWPLALGLCTASLWTVHVFHPGWQCHASNRCVNIEISHSTLQIDSEIARDVRLLRKLADQFAPGQQSFIAAPYWPGAYSLLERKSPMWAIYALIPRSKTFEKKEIERIKAANPRFALVFDLPFDGYDELRFRNTHPLIHQYILDNFDPLLDSPNTAYRIYKARGDTQPD